MSDTDGSRAEEGEVYEKGEEYYNDEEVDRMGRTRKVRGLDTSIWGSFRRDCIVFIVIVIIVIVIFIAVFLM